MQRYSNRIGYMEKTVDGQWLHQDEVDEKLKEVSEFWINQSNFLIEESKSVMKVYKIQTLFSIFLALAFFALYVTK